MKLQFGTARPGLDYLHRAATFGLVEQDGKLACVRVDRGEGSYFDLPGGAVDGEESEQQALVREFAEETGLFGVMALLALYCFIVARGLYIAAKSQDTFQRLAAGSLSLTFFIYVFVNIGMVAGLMPVVGVPLPLISYGGTSMVILLASFGILMSIHTHRKLLAT